MSRRPIVCSHCRKAVVAYDRPSGKQRRLITIDGRSYGVTADKPGVVLTICPACKQTAEIPGKLVIEAA
jgi:hypothetical protein